jgi:hypothetical protein
VADLSAIGADQRQPYEPGNVYEAIAHTSIVPVKRLGGQAAPVAAGDRCC